jgi:ABC-2 type transport system ATP-binding protein
VGLAHRAGHYPAELSGGQRQRAAIAQQMMVARRLLLLDEPFSGLDPVNSQVMKDVVVELAREGRTILFSTHIMEQAERMCDRIVIIARGEKIVDGRIADVKREFGGHYVALSFGHDAEGAGPVLRDRALVAQVDDYGASAEVRLAEGAGPDQLLSRLVAAGVGLLRFEVVEPSLNSIFIAKVGADAAVARAEEVALA